MKYRNKPVVIDAVQFRGRNKKEIEKFTEGKVMVFPNYVAITFLDGGYIGGRKGDWIIKRSKGEFYLCNQDTFKKTYEKVEE